MNARVTCTGRWSVAALTMALVMAALLLGAAPPAEAFGSSQPPPLPAVNAGGYMTCGVAEDGTAVCWGADEAPADPNTASGMATPPDDVQFTVVNAGYGTACGVTTDSAVVCWGNDRFGKVSGVPDGEYTHVAPGLNYVCALRTDQSIACWGGDDPNAPGADPDQKVVRDVPTAGAFTQLTMGIRHACALRTDDTVVCWGHNADGQIDVPEGTYTHVNAGNFTTCAIRTDGTAVCWGRNQGGQHTVPDGTFTMLTAGFAHVCGLRPDDSITCWGRSSEGQATPPAGTFTDVSTGTFHSCAMPAEGPPAICWGNNADGRVQPSMDATPPPAGTAGVPYNHSLTMATHVAPAPTFTLVDGALPAGVNLSPDGLLSGTPTEASSSTFTVAASSLGISPPDCPLGATGSLPCTPDDPTSTATATRVFTLEITADDPGAIAGTVADAGGAPIAGATVTATDSGGAQAGQATTDAAGAYTIDNLVAGDYTVVASASGYVTSDPQPAAVTSGETTTVDITLQAEDPGEGPTVVNVWNNHFDTVTDGLFIDWSEPIAAQFPDPDIGPGGYTLHEQPDCSDEAIAQGLEGFWTGGRPQLRDLVMDGWENVTYGGTYYLRVAAGTELGTESGQTNDLVPCFEFVAELSEDHQSTFAGQVTTGSGGPIAGATVTVTRTLREPGTVAGRATTDADGNYVVDHLAPGPYEVTADADGYQPLTQEATALGADTVTVDFALQPDVVDPGAIAGTVTDADSGESIAGATVTAVDGGGGEHTATTAGDGTYTIGTLAAGDYTVTASADGYLDSEPATVTVTAGETAPHDIGLQPDPATSRCGEVITEDTTLDADVGPCAGYGLVVAADNVTLDLGGHTVSGVAGVNNGAGILLDGVSGVTVQNGTVRDFDGGVAVDGGGGNHLEDLLIEDNIGTPATDWGEGVAFGNPVADNASNDNTICNSIVRNNGPYGGVAVYGTGTTGNVVGDPDCGEASLAGANAAGVGGNWIVDNKAEFTATVNQNDGVRLEPFTENTTVVNNLVENSGLDGVAIFSRSTDNVVVGNVVRDNGAHDKLHRFGSGIISFAGSARNVIDENTVTDNAANGIVLRGPTGPQPGSMDNVVRDNFSVGNAAMQHEDPGAPFADLHDANVDPPCDNNVWSGNVYGTVFQGCEANAGTQVPAITGQVTDAESGEPIAGATVSADGQSTTTDADGSFTFEAVEPGEYTVTADADGYEPGSETVTVGEGELVTVDLALQPEARDPATRRDCMNGGWRDYGFRNQGQCIRFVQTGQDSRP